MLVLYKFEFVINDLHIIGFDFRIFYFSRHQTYFCQEWIHAFGCVPYDETVISFKLLLRGPYFVYWISGMVYAVVWHMPLHENNYTSKSRFFRSAFFHSL